MAEDAVLQPKCRPVAGTERSWCKAVPGGTGITVLALLLSKPLDIPLLQNSLRKLQTSHPILNSQLRFQSGAGNPYSFFAPPAPRITIQPLDRNSTAEILLRDPSISPFHLILEHELNRNAWLDPESDADTFFASLYDLDGGRRVLALRLHTAVCDRATAAAILAELLRLLAGEGDCDGERELGFGIEDCVPKGKARKAFWARGLDMLGYSLNSFRLSNVAFLDTHSPRSSRVARMRLGKPETGRVLDVCETRGVKLCGVLGAAGLIAARSSKQISESHSEKYCVVTLIDCRSVLDPQLISNHAGFYHSAVLNTHDVKGREDVWELAKRTYTAFANAKENGKHFTDIADMNFLMGKALENPGLTPHSSMRTSFISVFEDPIVTDHQSSADQVGLEDFVACSSVHGIGPSMAVFHTIRDGELDCAFVYPSPLHSRQQMQGLIDEMKRTLVEW